MTSKLEPKSVSTQISRVLAVPLSLLGGTTTCRLTLGGTTAQSGRYYHLADLETELWWDHHLTALIVDGTIAQTTWEIESQAMPPSTVTLGVECIVQSTQFSLLLGP